MNRIVDWMRKLRLGNRHRRVELLGGHPGQNPRVPVERFEADLGKDGRLKAVRDKVGQLGAESVDEATGNVLDTLITRQGRDWDRRLDQQYEAYRARATQRLDQAEAIAYQYKQLLEADHTRLRHAEAAVETAVLALSGHEPERMDGRVRPIRIVPEPPAAAPDAEAAPSSGTAFDDEGSSSRTRENPSRPWKASVSPTPPNGAAASRDSERASFDGPASLRPSRLERFELRRLLEPQDANRVPRWGEVGFRDGTLLAGRPRGAFLHALALLLAAGADVGAFTQTVQLVLPQADWVALLVVFGLTAVVLYIAHMVGVMLREASAARDSAGNRRRLGRGLTAFVCTLVWLGVGVLAFWVRYTVPLPVAPQVGGCGVIGSGSTGGCSPSGAGHGHALQAAAIFLGLYLATGIVAAVGAYVTHNPYRGGYVTAIRAYRRASERASASIHQVGLALAAHQRQQAEIEAAKEILAQAKDQNNAFTDQLKQEALIEIASLLKDPAVTDAFFT